MPGAGKMKKYTFTVSILSLFSAMTLILTFFLISNFYYRGMEHAYKITESKITEINKNITETLSDSLRSTGNKLSVLANITENPEILENRDIFTRIMWEQLKSDRNLSSIYAADMKGNFIQIRREPELALRVLDSAAATDE